ncbi:hypothetical protein Tco_0474944 [Tanacetum coccineum]
MAALLIYDELRNSARKLDWESQFILRCRREIVADLRLAREINALCTRVIAIVDERERFVDELDLLMGRYVPDKMADFMKEVQGKDTPNLLQLRLTAMKLEAENLLQAFNVYFSHTSGDRLPARKGVVSLRSGRVQKKSVQHNVSKGSNITRFGYLNLCSLPVILDKSSLKSSSSHKELRITAECMIRTFKMIF